MPNRPSKLRNSRYFQRNFRSLLEVKASSSGFFGSAAASADFKTSNTSTSTSSIAITKSETFTITAYGPASDGIDHDQDLFYLWLNPHINVTIDPQYNLNWGLGVDGPTMDVQYVYTGWLRNPSTMPSGVKQKLDAAKITAAEYKTILELNPFVFGSTKIDQKRFHETSFSFPYEPPFAAGDEVPTDTYQLQSTVVDTASQETEVSYSVAVEASEGLKVGVFSASVDTTGTFTWTSSATDQASNSSTQTATVTIGGPSYGYSGATDILVYWDVIYNSFYFHLPDSAPSITGQVKNSQDKPAAHKEVELVVGTRKWRTFTGRDGKYRFYYTNPGDGEILVSSEKFPVKLANDKKAIDIHLTKS